MKRLVLICAIFLSFISRSYAENSQEIDLYDLSLEDLLAIKVGQPASLTKTASKTVPAAVTLITAENIRQSAARSLNELLEIYVPGLQYIDHFWGFAHLGARGIMSDRDDKYLLLVNGRTMNERTVVGAITERDLNMLGDIHHIDIIRGPGSATYGVGAVSMVINIVTFNHQNFEGNEQTFRSGIAGERFDMFEHKYAKTFGSGNGGFLYFGISDFRGADYEDAPVRTAADRTDRNGNNLPAETDVNLNIGNDKRQYRDKAKLKFHTQWQWDDWDFWLRYTRGGDQKPSSVSTFTFDTPAEVGSTLGGVNQLGSQQASFVTAYNYVINPSWKINYKLSYDAIDYERFFSSGSVQSFREDEALVRVLANWEPETQHSIALGMESNHEKFGLNSPGFPDEPSNIPGYDDNPHTWSTNTHSLFFEHQWSIKKNLSSFVSGRLDKNTYTKVLASPRFSLVYVVNKKDTLKWIMARSQRMNFSVDMRNEYLFSGTEDTEPEVLDSLEFRWSHEENNGFSSAISTYYESIDLIGFIESDEANNRHQDVLAEEEQWGLELELQYKTQQSLIDFSHAYTKLEKFDLEDGVKSSFVTVKPNGYGSKFTNWSHNLSKLSASHTYNDNWAWHGSLIYYWEFDGSKDRARYRFENSINTDPYQAGNNEIYGANLYLNIGTEYTVAEGFILGFNGHNLLGLVDKTHNKRNYYLADDGLYRLQAPSLSLSLNWKM